MELYTPPASPQPENQPPQNLQQARAVRLSEVRRRRQHKKAPDARPACPSGRGGHCGAGWGVPQFGDGPGRPGRQHPHWADPRWQLSGKTGIGQLYQVEKLAGGFVELGEKDVVLASASGLKLRTIQHGYARPALRWAAAGSACTTGPGTPCGWKAEANPSHADAGQRHSGVRHEPERQPGGGHPLQPLHRRSEGVQPELCVPLWLEHHRQ